MKLKKAVVAATVLTLCLSMTCVGQARKHKKSQNTDRAVTALEANAEDKVTANKQRLQPKVENAPAQETQTSLKSTKEEATNTKDSTPLTPITPPKPVKQLPYVLLADDMSNLQSDPTKPLYDKYSIQERKEKGLPTTLPQIQPYQQGKIAYLTFDDGPDASNTDAILDILQREGIKGTFYVVGNQCYNYPETLKRIFNEGHAIGNHSYSHDYDNLYPNVNNFLSEMYKTEKVLRELIGVRPLIIRAPGGTAGMFTKDYYPTLNYVGLAEHDWNVCIDDAVGGHPLAWEFVQKVREQTSWGINPAIVLMHSSYGKGETVRALPEIIQLLRDRGYSFGVVTPMTPQPW